MKKLLILALIPQLAMAECNFATDVQKVEGGYLYTTSCHKNVGKIVTDSKDKDAQITHLNNALSLSKLALDFSDKRNEKLMNTVVTLDDRVNTIDKYNSTNKFLYFGAGILAAGLAVYGASQLRK